MNRLWQASIVAAGIGVGLGLALPAAAQERVWQDGRWIVLPPPAPPRVMPTEPGRWTRGPDGRWDGGTRAPGGWSAYHRLGRGAVLPPYWMGGPFRVPDYLRYGLPAPPPGYFWVRYYDDAVLADTRGNVWDAMSGIAWNDRGVTMAEARPAGAPYPPPPVEPDARPRPDARAYPDPRDDYRPAPPPPPPPPPAPIPAYDRGAPVVTRGATVTVVQAGPGVVTLRQAPDGRWVRGDDGYGDGYGYGYADAYAAGAYPAGATVVVIQPAPVVTTTTRVVEERIVTVRGGRYRHKTVRRQGCACR